MTTVTTVTCFAMPKAAKGTQDLSNTAWSLGQQVCKDVALISSVALAAEKRLKRGCSPREISVFAWAFAKLGFSSKPLMDAIGRATLAKMEEFDALQISSTRWAFAKLRFEHQEVLERLSQVAIRRSHEFSARHISNMVWSCAT